MDFKNELNNLSYSIKQKLEFIDRELSSCAEGTLSFETRNNVKHLVQVRYENGRRTRHNLTKHPEVTSSLLRRMLLEKERDVLVHNLKLVDSISFDIASFDQIYEMKKIRDCLPDITVDVMKQALVPKTITDWEKADYEHSMFHPEALRHLTSRGIKVRSKSEALIAEKLYEHNLAVRYEQIIDINGLQFAPDFTILRSDGKIVYWEHMGCTNKQEYIEKQLNKLRIYASYGIVPWKNLIISFDDEYGNIDLRDIESKIVNRLIV